MTLAAILFTIAALTGITLALIRLNGRDIPPLWLALLHGVFAASGLVSLGIAAFTGSAPQWARLSLFIFVVAALGGFALFSFHLRRRALPVPLIAIHALVAVVGFAILVINLLG